MHLCWNAITGVFRGNEVYLLSIHVNYNTKHILILIAKWMANIQDANANVDSFFNQCYIAGPKKCPIYLSTGAEDMKMTYLDLVEEIIQNHLPVSAHQNSGSEIITYQVLFSVIKAAHLFPSIAAKQIYTTGSYNSRPLLG